MRFILLTIFISSFAYANTTSVDIPAPVAIKDPFENEEKIQICIDQGTDPRTCKDPDWCLYPSNLETKDCQWYKESI
jgi:hypothetical protein